jgi:hypothetical protein
MTSVQLAELFLMRIYDYAEQEGHGRHFDLLQLAAEFGVTDKMKIRNVSTYLSEHRLIERRSSPHGIRASITGEGSIFVERGGTTGVIGAFRHMPSQYLVSNRIIHFHSSVTGSNIAVDSSSSQTLTASQPIDQLLSEMIAVLRSDSSLAERRRAEALTDVELVRVELQRERPRRSVIESLLSDFGNIATLASLFLQLQPHLSSIFR